MHKDRVKDRKNGLLVWNIPSTLEVSFVFLSHQYHPYRNAGRCRQPYLDSGAVLCRQPYLDSGAVLCCYGNSVGSLLQNEDEPGEPEQAVGDAPPPYSSISAESAAYFDYKDECGFPKPPSYNVATTLPSYDEAERTKAEATIPLVPGRDEDFVGRDDFDDADQLRIGNDGIFMLTFFMAFLFNWIGFFLSFCLTTSAAGRYGAISGFGLSLIKWILIVRFSTYFPGYFDGQYWLWWVFLVLGFLLFLRGFINYAKVRKMPETFSNLPRTRVLFIY
ncbi:NEDD4 family-interacting protein 1 isoform X2 [Ailuropoda melanoleuca]|uniref:NEDD4 family-interacting protein 1 isoform X2 n=1 Tax=Ailuropoda melanoleuca TaxID=9646 RepID=UPI0014946115|nr:NEDD4 family-interacting protein 1 isoform X2 [Ailuropoda melanoleuca]